MNFLRSKTLWEDIFLSFTNSKMGPEKEITQLMDVINHDFKVPLTSIAFTLQSMKRTLVKDDKEDKNETLLKQIESIENKTNQMSLELEHFIDLARVHIQELPLKKNLTHTHALLIEVLQSSKEKVELENHQLNQYCTINGDRDRLVKVFANVINGLSTLTAASSSIKVSTKIKGGVAQFVFKNEVHIEDATLIKTIFDKFYVLNDSRASLGLSLSKWIIEAHQGTMSIFSCKQEGTTFTIELPRMELEELKALLH